jgi:transposase
MYSKLAMSRALAEETKETTLGEVMRVANADEDDLYAAMDWLLARQERVEKALARRGHSRDGKKGTLQIVFGLVTDKDGRPVAVEVFEGNTADPKTVATQVTKLRERFGLKRVVMVGDRGMITSARIREDLKTTPGIDWITTLRAPAIRKLAERGALQLSLFDEKDLVEITDSDYPGERLVVCRNPLLADERARKRQELLAATAKDLTKIVAAIQRDKRPLRGEKQIALRVGKVLGRYKMAKHFNLTIAETSFGFERDEARIAEEAKLDGIYVVRASVPVEAASSEETVRWYKRLAVVERAFRSIKTVDLHVRPIAHRRADRVRAHILLCMLAYYVEWHLRRAVAPMLFDDADKAAGEALRSSVVAPAQPSPSARRKAITKRTDDGAPVHSFQSLLRDLATIAKNRIKPKALGGCPST